MPVFHSLLRRPKARLGGARYRHRLGDSLRASASRGDHNHRDQNEHRDARLHAPLGRHAPPRLTERLYAPNLRGSTRARNVVSGPPCPRRRPPPAGGAVRCSRRGAGRHRHRATRRSRCARCGLGARLDLRRDCRARGDRDGASESEPPRLQRHRAGRRPRVARARRSALRSSTRPSPLPASTASTSSPSPSSRTTLPRSASIARSASSRRDAASSTSGARAESSGTRSRWGSCSDWRPNPGLKPGVRRAAGRDPARQLPAATNPRAAATNPTSITRS